MQKILVWLSGWVDSAVAAYLLKKKWYEVTAGFMKNYISENWNCTTYQDAQEAIKVADFLWIKIISFDLQKEYEKKILNYIYQWYKKWITPNPDVLCNNLIKFDVFLKKAIKMWFDKIATWHYANIKEEKITNNQNKIYRLIRWKDKNKDQTYFLSWLDQYQLSKSIFPIWSMTKDKVRKIAKEIWLPNADRKDSQGLCFVGNIPIKNFLEQKLDKKTWDIIDTIWQRHGLNLPVDRYVTSTDINKNIVYVWPREDTILNKKEIWVKNWVWIADHHKLPMRVKAKIRYRSQLETAQIKKDKNNKLVFVFDKKQWAVAPWQVIVWYIWQECIGNWIII